MKLPAIVLFEQETPLKTENEDATRLMTSPRTVEPEEVRVKSVAPPRADPSISIRRAALSPTASVLKLAPGWV